MKAALDLCVKIYKGIMDYTSTMHFNNTALRGFAAKDSNPWVLCTVKHIVTPFRMAFFGVSKNTILLKGKLTDRFQNLTEIKKTLTPYCFHLIISVVCQSDPRPHFYH